MLHIALSILLFLGAAGLVVNTHYCQGQLKSIALFKKATPCYQKQAGKKICPAHAAKAHNDGDKGCCKDKTQLVKAEDEQLPVCQQLLKIELPGQWAAPLFKAPLVYQSFVSGPIEYLNYKPPLITCDYCIQLQRFLC